MSNIVNNHLGTSIAKTSIQPFDSIFLHANKDLINKIIVDDYYKKMDTIIKRVKHIRLTYKTITL